MNYLKQTRWSLLVIGLLIIASLACNLSRGDDSNKDDDPFANSNNTVQTNPDDGVPPTVTVFTPQDGQQVLVGTSVDVQINAQHPVGITRLQMRIVEEDRIVSSKSLLDDPTSIDVLLVWKPERQGSFTLEIQAFRAGTASEAHAVTLQVFPEGSILSNPASGQQTAIPIASGTNCSVRIVIGDLNMRSGPGTNNSALGKFNLGETASVEGQNTDSSGSIWLKVKRESGTQGWVIDNSQWLEKQGTCTSLPTVN